MSAALKPEGELDGHQRLQTAFMLAVGLQLLLLIAVLGLSALGKQQTARALAFDNAARSLHLDFEEVSSTLNRFQTELTASDPSKPYIEALQRDLEPQLGQLKQSIRMIMPGAAETDGLTALRGVDTGSLSLFESIQPDLDAFIQRAERFLSGDLEALQAQFRRPSVVDLAAARPSLVRRSLEQIAANARQRQAQNLSYLQTGNFIAVALLLLLLLTSWIWIIKPALARQKQASLREKAFLEDLKRKNIALRQAESQARLLYEDAMTGIRARTEFLAVVSHELRTPLNAVIGFSEIMKDEILGAHAVGAYRGYATDIHSSGQHLLGIVEDILEFSRYESGHYALEEAPLSIETVFEDAKILIGERAKERNIALVFQNACPTDWLVRVDRRLFNQALLNLIDNAVKFSPDGSRIVVCGTKDADGGLRVTVIDTGIGMDPKAVPVLLRPFEQIEGAFTRQAGGLGLGLAITNKIMTAHGGTITVTTAKGKGSRFSLILPAERISLQATPARQDSNGKVA